MQGYKERKSLTDKYLSAGYTRIPDSYLLKRIESPSESDRIISGPVHIMPTDLELDVACLRLSKLAKMGKVDEKSLMIGFGGGANAILAIASGVGNILLADINPNQILAWQDMFEVIRRVGIDATPQQFISEYKNDYIRKGRTYDFVTSNKSEVFRNNADKLESVLTSFTKPESFGPYVRGSIEEFSKFLWLSSKENYKKFAENVIAGRVHLAVLDIHDLDTFQELGKDLEAQGLVTVMVHTSNISLFSRRNRLFYRGDEEKTTTGKVSRLAISESRINDFYSCISSVATPETIIVMTSGRTGKRHPLRAHELRNFQQLEPEFFLNK